MFVAIRTIALTGALFASLGLPLVAQRGGPPMIPGQGPGANAARPDNAPPRAPRGPAGMLLAARTQLGLSDEQVKRLESLATQQAVALAPAPGDMLRARADLMDAMKGEGDAAALKRAMDKAHQLRTERAVAMLKARQDARAILTADQRTKADAMRPMRGMRGARGMRGGQGMRGMRGMQGRGGMMGGGQMRGGMWRGSPGDFGPGNAPMPRPDRQPGRPPEGEQP
jgi:hypothetical protein